MHARARYLIVAVTLILLALPRVAKAHPMGNFSVNHYAKILAGTQYIEIYYIIDMAEIPTFQEIQQDKIVTRVGDPSLTPYLRRQSESLKNGLTVVIDGAQMQLETLSRQAIFPPGAGGLPTMKLGFIYEARLPRSVGSAPQTLHYRDGNFPDRAGWKEIVALSQPGCALVNSSVPSADRSLELSNYPTDMLHSPPQSLSADLTFKAAPPSSERVNSQYKSAAKGWLVVPGAVPIASTLRLAANRQTTPRSAFTDLIKSNRMDLTFLVMAALIAAVLGGFHALEPGHGKTLVAAYLVGSHGTARQAVLLGTVVTASHTVSVYLLGIITLYASQWILPEQLYPWLGIGSGLLVAGLGFTLFIRRYLATESTAQVLHAHGDGKLHLHERNHENSVGSVHRHTWWGGHVNHTHPHKDIHTDMPDHDDGHLNLPRHAVAESSDEIRTISLKSLLALGITGGIVPCPAALVVLLGALAFHRIAFGLFLIVAFSAGLAAVLIGFGLAMVYAGRFMSRFGAGGPLTERWLPLASSAVITVVGVALTLQSLASAGVLRTNA
jgi:ABC-type nickel/cobalt efflux system permease component RcnA